MSVMCKLWYLQVCSYLCLGFIYMFTSLYVLAYLCMCVMFILQFFIKIN